MLRILLLVLCLGSSAFAEEKKQKNAYEEKKGNVDVGVARSSSVNRRDKTIAISVGAGFESVAATFSFSLSYIIDEHLAIELRASEGENTSTTNGFTETDNFSSASLGVRYYSTDTFYFRPAFEYIETQNGDSSGDATITGSGFSFTVGNQWQYRNFIVGVDWIGIKHIINARTITNDADRTHLSLAGFYVGTSF